jgi:hypothetical protein
MNRIANYQITLPRRIADGTVAIACIQIIPTVMWTNHIGLAMVGAMLVKGIPRQNADGTVAIVCLD